MQFQPEKTYFTRGVSNDRAKARTFYSRDAAFDAAHRFERAHKSAATEPRAYGDVFIVAIFHDRTGEFEGFIAN